MESRSFRNLSNAAHEPYQYNTQNAFMNASYTSVCNAMEY